MKVYKCDRCGKIYKQKHLLEKDKSVIFNVAILYAHKGEARQYYNLDLCEDCLKKFIEFMENKNEV